MSKDYVIKPPPKEKGDEPLFRVVYVIDVNAAGPKEAAEVAYQIMADPDSMPPVLYVIDDNRKSVKIDLSKES